MASGSNGSGKRSRLAAFRTKKTAAAGRSPKLVANSNGNGGFNGAPF